MTDPLVKMAKEAWKEFGQEYHEKRLAKALEERGRPTTHLSYINDNAIQIVAHVSRCCKRQGWTEAEARSFRAVALSGTYRTVLTTSMNVLDEDCELQDYLTTLLIDDIRSFND